MGTSQYGKDLEDLKDNEHSQMESEYPEAKEKVKCAKYLTSLSLL